MESLKQKIWECSKENLFSENTELFYDYRTGLATEHRFDCLPCREEILSGFPNPCGWGTGMEDCAINAGLTLEIARVLEPDATFGA